MIRLWNNFLGYIKISYPRIPWILLFACILLVVFELLQRTGCLRFNVGNKCSLWSKIALSLTISFIFVLTLFGRTPGDYSYSLIPFASYRRVVDENNLELLLEIIMNIATYIPIGFLLPCCFRYFEKPWRVLVVAIIFALGIELIQGFAKIGHFEIDDVINNILGAGLGLIIFIIVTKTQQRAKGESL